MNYPDGANMDKVLNEVEYEECFYIVNFDSETENKINCLTQAIEKAKALTAYYTADAGSNCSSVEVVYVERSENTLDDYVTAVATVIFNEEEFTWEIKK